MSVSNTFHALSDPNRHKILELLKQKDLSVNEILSNLNITGASLSHHLNVLKNADLVSSTRKGQKIIYSLNLSVFEEVLNIINKFTK